MNDSPPALELHDVCAGYGRIKVLRHVSLAVPQGSVFALLGPNGAGKTTLLKVASGQLPLTSGEVTVSGTPVTALVPERIARRGLCTVPEGRGIFPNLTVAENVRMWAHARRVKKQQVDERVYTWFPQLASRRSQPAGSLSGGEQQMLAVSRALSTDPSMIIIDELSIGLAPKIVLQLYQALSTVAQQGTGVLIAEQNTEAALSVANNAAILSHGCVAIAGSPELIRAAAPELYLQGRSTAIATQTTPAQD